MEPAEFISVALRLATSQRDAGASLLTLRNQRNAADYDLDSNMFDNRENVLRTVLLAPEIADALERCDLEPAFSETRAKIRGYARDVLRVTVREDDNV